MPRPLRIEFPGAWYYIAQFARPKSLPFSRTQDKSEWGEVIKAACQLYGIEIHAYCLFPAHFHLLVHTPNARLSASMRYINGVFTQRYQNAHHVSGPLFPNRFKSVLLDVNQGYVQRFGRFIHRLPRLYRFRDPLFKFPDSSYPMYLQECPNQWDIKVSTLLGYHHGTHKLKSFYAYTESDTDTELVRFYKKKKWTPVMGSPQTQTQTQDSSPETIMSLIVNSTASIFNESISNIRESRRGRGNIQIGRSVAMYLCRHFAHLEIKPIADYFNVSHFSAVTIRLKRFEVTLNQNPSLRQKVSLLKHTIGQFKLS